MKHTFLPPTLAAWSRTGAVVALCLFGTLACTSADTPGDTATEAPVIEAPAETPRTTETAAVTFADVESPEGGMVKQITLAGPESAALITCDQAGFVPFAYADAGLDWVGCQLPNPGDTPGPESSLTEPVIEDVESPIGGTVQQVTIPGPQSAVAVACADDFKPFLYEDQGHWVGCSAP